MGSVTGTQKPDGPLPRFLLHPDAALRALLGWLADRLPILLLAVGLAAVVLIAWRLWTVRRDRALMRRSRRIRILSPAHADPAGAGTLWMGLQGLLRPRWRRALFGQPYLAWEILATSEDVEVSLVVPHLVPPGLVERVVEASWPGARTQIADGDSLARIVGQPAIETTALVLAEPQWFPIGTTPGDDPFTLGLAAMAGLAGEEAALIQVIAEPSPSFSKLRFRRAARRLRGAAGRSWQPGRRSRPPSDPTVEPDVRAILAKASSPLWRCQVRLAVGSPSRDTARGRIHGLAGAFAVFEGRNGFRRRRNAGGMRTVRARRMTRSYLLSVPELAQVASLPAAGTIPGLERAGARTVAPPRILPAAGKVLGRSDHAGVERAVAVSVEDARHHLHVIGETGTGKSTLLANLVLQDVQAGRSTVVIDPKGDLVQAVLERLPADAADRTCLVDPDDKKRAVGLNVLEGEDPDLVVDHIAAVFKRIYEPWWGPRTDDIMRAACLTLTQIPGTTLAEVPLLLTHVEWRRAIQLHLTDVVGVSAFWKWYDRLPEPQRAQHTAPLLNKLRAFVLRGPVRAIVGQAESRLDIDALLDSGGLLLVRIPKGTVGEETSRLLGAFVITRVWQACMKRAARAEADRPDSALYVDEMHNYLVLPRSFEDLLAEARGYRLSLVLAHQHMGQLPREMRDALGANARTKVVFTCSPEDAFALARHFAPDLSEQDLSHLGAFQAACRPCVGGGQAQALTFRTAPLAAGSAERSGAVRARSASLFATNRSVAEAKIRYRQTHPVERLVPRRVLQSANQSTNQSGARSGAHSRASGSRTRVRPGEEGS
jgi:hypothetical protein